jgi:hypothetical protein
MIHSPMLVLLLQGQQSQGVLQLAKVPIPGMEAHEPVMHVGDALCFNQRRRRPPYILQLMPQSQYNG